jgi:hypothetical protein
MKMPAPHPGNWVQSEVRVKALIGKSICVTTEAKPLECGGLTPPFCLKIIRNLQLTGIPQYERKNYSDEDALRCKGGVKPPHSKAPFGRISC